mgnify:CR=1 FL=1
MRQLLLLFIVLLAVPAFGQSVPYDSTQIPQERVVDFISLDLVLDINPKKEEVTGTASYRWESLRPRIDSLFLHAKSMTVNRVLIDGEIARYRQDDDGVHVFPNPPAKGAQTMVVEYVANPTKGLYFNGWQGKGRKQIWSQGQGIKNRHWFPCFDLQHDKLTTSLEISFDKDYTVISNGKLEFKKQEGNKTRWKYQMLHPQSSYLVALIIGEYEVMQQRSPYGTPVENYFYPDYPQQAEPTFVETNQLLSYLEAEIGVGYPWGVYRQAPVEYFLYGAMENTTAVVLNDKYMVDDLGRIDRNYVYVNAHEMAHHWFGDFLTARTGRDHWLQEGFATYYGALGERAMLGDDVANYSRWLDYKNVLTAQGNQKYPLAHNKAGSLTHYQKGRLVLDMLKEEVGEAVFRTVISEYVMNNAYGLVDSDELLDAFQDYAGRSLGWFWDQWVYSKEVPTLRVDVDTTAGESEKIYGFTLRQIQPSKAYRFGWNWEVVLESGSRLSGREAVSEKEHRWEVSIPAGQKIKHVLFDPEGVILKQFIYPYSREELLSIVADTAHYFSRAQALYELRRFPGVGSPLDYLKVEPKETKLLKLWVPTIQPYHHESKVLGLSWLRGDKPELYSTAWTLLGGSFELSDSLLYKELMMKGSPQFVAEMTDDLLTAFGVNAGFLLTSAREGDNGHNLTITRSKWKAQWSDEKAEIDRLIEFGSDSCNSQTRLNAWNALRSLDYFDKKLKKQLEQASEHYNWRFRNAAKLHLKYYEEAGRF